ncbi:MAG: DsbA family protein [Hyphomicrobiaceae bacterium]|nr:DsbA family protein [Hyphomicrobiaceae bacterium]
MAVSQFDAVRSHLGRPHRLAILVALTLAGAAALVVASGPRAAAEGEAVKAATEAAAKAPFSEEQKAGIRDVVREYLLKNPELFLDIQSELEKKLEEIQSARLETAVKENAADLFRRSEAPIAGNPQGDITVVEFFDYNCGYCKRGLGDVAKLIETDKKVKVVFKELPILSKGSEEAARVALAAKKQGKYWEVHSALLSSKGKLDGESALGIAGKLGLDVAKLKADMTSAEVDAELLSVQGIAQKMGISGTPYFLVGDKAIPGAPENLHEQLAAHVKSLRDAGGCQVC